MSRNVIAVSAAMLLGFAVLLQPAWPHSGEAVDPWSRAHLDNLPPEIRAQAQQWEAACGAPIAAAQEFALYLSVPGAQYVALHYDDFRCRNKTAQCDASGCLHEVYVSTGGRYRRVLQVHAHDIRLLRRGDAAFVEIIGAAGARIVPLGGRSTGSSKQRSF